MLRVVKVGDVRTVTVESDDYTALAVDWVEVGSVRPVYYRVSGRTGGDVEVKLEPLTGEVVGLVVIQQPTHHVAVPDPGKERRSGAVFVDLVDWEPNPDLVPQREVVCETQALAMGEGESQIYYSWLPEKPTNFVWSGRVGLGISTEGLLTGVLVARSAMTGSTGRRSSASWSPGR